MLEVELMQHDFKTKKVEEEKKKEEPQVNYFAELMEAVKMKRKKGGDKVKK